MPRTSETPATRLGLDDFLYIFLTGSNIPTESCLKQNMPIPRKKLNISSSMRPSGVTHPPPNNKASQHLPRS
jgi:hypothetical protein